MFGNLTVAGVLGAGFVTAYGCDDGIPKDSSGNISKADLNYNGAVSAVSSNRLIVKADADGDVCFYTLASAEMIIDINGVTETGVTAIANQRTDTRTTTANVGECDPSVPHSKGAFEFDPQVDESLPESWRSEFAVILATLQAVAPISPCLHDSRENPAKSPMKIYAWSSAVGSPFEDERPGMAGASVSSNGTDTWMVLEIYAQEFEYDDLHRYSVVAHEYWHVYQRGAWTGQGLSYPDWMWEGGAKVFEELYVSQNYGQSQFDNNLSPVIATALGNPSDFELYAVDGGAVGGDYDMSYNTSSFMVLALAKELQERQGLSEAESLRLVLTASASSGSGTPFLDVFGMSLEDFYTSLAQYPAIASTEDWFEGTVIDASGVMPSKSLTLDEILQPAE